MRNWHRNYSELCFFFLGIDSEITHNFAYFENIAQGHRGIDSEIDQNFAIFEKMAQEKLRILHGNFVRGNSGVGSCTIALYQCPIPQTRPR